MGISNRGFWTSTNIGDSYPFDKSLTDHLAQTLFKGKVVADFGCGRGKYVDRLNNFNIKCYGYDGNPLTKEINPNCNILDLSQPIQLNMKFNWILSLEVGEHIPKEYEHVFIDNINRHNIEGVILSWAIVDQGGYGHVNEQPNQYIKQKMKDIGYRNDIKTETSLRYLCELKWLKNTLMVFKRIIF